MTALWEFCVGWIVKDFFCFYLSWSICYVCSGRSAWMRILSTIPEVNLRSCETYTVKLFAKVVNGFFPLTVFNKRSIIVVLKGLKYASALLPYFYVTWFLQNLSNGIKGWVPLLVDCAARKCSRVLFSHFSLEI